MSTDFVVHDAMPALYGRNNQNHGLTIYGFQCCVDLFWGLRNIYKYFAKRMEFHFYMIYLYIFIM